MDERSSGARAEKSRHRRAWRCRNGARSGFRQGHTWGEGDCRLSQKHTCGRGASPPAGDIDPVVGNAELEPFADLVVECAPAECMSEIAEPFLRKGKTVVALSASALLAREHLIKIAHENGGQIVIPTGALLGLDAVNAAAEGAIQSVRMTTRKPVKSLADAPYLALNGIHIEDIREPLRIFSGTAREAANGFPANINVVVALALAGIGVDRTHIEIWADPTVDKNMHTIEVVSDSASFTMNIANIPSENPKTGRITALSVLAYLRKLSAPLRVGT